MYGYTLGKAKSSKWPRSPTVWKETHSKPGAEMLKVRQSPATAGGGQKSSTCSSASRFGASNIAGGLTGRWGDRSKTTGSRKIKQPPLDRPVGEAVSSGDVQI